MARKPFFFLLCLEFFSLFIKNGSLAYISQWWISDEKSHIILTLTGDTGRG
jgi:hypothetical protein